MRKWMGIFAAAVMAASLAGCNGASQPSGSSSSGETQPSATLTGPTSGKPYTLVQENRTVYQNLRYVPRMLSEETVERLRAALVKEEGNIFEYKENEGFAGLPYVFFRGSSDYYADVAAPMTEEQAVNMADDFLKSMGIFPENDYIVWSKSASSSSTDISFWRIVYYPAYKDVTVVFAGRIDMILSKGGISNFSYSWASVEGSDEPYDEAELISAEEALAQYEEHHPAGKNGGYVQRLYWMNPDGVIHPGWFICWSHPLDSGPVIDAVTGYYSG